MANNCSIVFRNVCGEAGDVNEENLSGWAIKLLSHTEGYEPNANANEI
jgi:hypothetical protein